MLNFAGVLFMFVPCLASRSMNHPCIAAPQGIVTLQAQVACRILSAAGVSNPFNLHIWHHTQAKCWQKNHQTKRSRENRIGACRLKRFAVCMLFHLKVSGPKYDQRHLSIPRVSLPQQRCTEFLGNARSQNSVPSLWSAKDQFHHGTRCQYLQYLIGTKWY